MIITGDYIRNKYGIARVIKAETKNGIYTVQLDKDIAFIFDTRAKKEIKRTNILPITEDVNLSKLKISSNIIDLIEVGDYVNGDPVVKAAPDLFDLMIPKKERLKRQIVVDSSLVEYGELILEEEDIKTIITKEQIELIEYKVGDKKCFVNQI